MQSLGLCAAEEPHSVQVCRIAGGSHNNLRTAHGQHIYVVLPVQHLYACLAQVQQHPKPDCCSLLLQGAPIVAHLLPLLRFLQAVTHHASKPAEPERLPPTHEDFALGSATEADAPAADIGLTSASTAGVLPSRTDTPAAGSSGGAVAEAEAGAAAGAAPGAGGADLAPLAVIGAVRGSDEGSEDSEAEDMDEGEYQEEDIDEEIDNAGSAWALLSKCKKAKREDPNKYLKENLLLGAFPLLSAAVVCRFGCVGWLGR